jgi:hypothetical protein
MTFSIRLTEPGHRKAAAEILRASRRSNRKGGSFHHYVLQHAHTSATRRSAAAANQALSPTCCTVAYLNAHADLMREVAEAFRLAHNMSSPPPASYLLAPGWSFL